MEYIKSLKDRFWAFFKNSGTILMSRLTAIVGFVVAVLGSLDWNSIANYIANPMGITNTQLAWMGIFFVVQGISAELVRRSNTKEVDSVLVSKSTETVATKAIKKPGKLKKVKNG